MVVDFFFAGRGREKGVVVETGAVLGVKEGLRQDAGRLMGREGRERQRRQVNGAIAA